MNIDNLKLHQKRKRSKYENDKANFHYSQQISLEGTIISDLNIGIDEYEKEDYCHSLQRRSLLIKKLLIPNVNTSKLLKFIFNIEENK